MRMAWPGLPRCTKQDVIRFRYWFDGTMKRFRTGWGAHTVELERLEEHGAVVAGPAVAAHGPLKVAPRVEHPVHPSEVDVVLAPSGLVGRASQDARPQGLVLLPQLLLVRHLHLRKVAVPLVSPRLRLHQGERKFRLGGGEGGSAGSDDLWCPRECSLQ